VSSTCDRSPRGTANGPGDPRAPGFFQIGGGIAGDFPICVVPMLRYDLKEDVPVWSYFCQISDSTTSYGSYSGAEPNEKITWGKLSRETPRFVIESDATIVAPLVFGYILASARAKDDTSRYVWDTMERTLAFKLGKPGILKTDAADLAAAALRCEIGEAAVLSRRAPDKAPRKKDATASQREPALLHRPRRCQESKQSSAVTRTQVVTPPERSIDQSATPRARS
jgi:hypothetical protein